MLLNLANIGPSEQRKLAVAEMYSGGGGSNQPSLEREKFCDLCNDNIMGDEYHFLMECKHQPCTLQKSVYTKLLSKRPNTLKFIALMEHVTINGKLALRFGSFLKKIHFVY